MDKRFLLVAAVIGGAAVFAATRSREQPIQPVAVAPQAQAPVASPSGLPPGHPPIGGMPNGHPAVPSGLPSGHPPIGNAQLPAAEASLQWTAPARWQPFPNPSPMRLATYRIPKVTGDIEDPEMSITRAGGDVEQNALRWVSQFDEPSRPSAKRATKTIGAYKVHFVEVEGTYTSMKGEQEENWAMVGAIVETEGGHHFFKLTGPKKSVASARAEVDALLASLKAK